MDNKKRLEKEIELFKVTETENEKIKLFRVKDIDNYIFL